ncbi:MAG: flagellin [Alphaproteobacteria bacterium]
MIPTSIATLAQETTLMNRILKTQSEILKTQNQISTQKVAERYSEIASDSGRLVNLKSAQTRLDRFMINNDLVKIRLQTMEQHTSQIFDIATEFRTLLVSALNTDTNAEDIVINGVAADRMGMVASLLNVEIEGRHLFSGMKTDTPPVDLNDAAFLPPPAAYPSIAADTSYYQGDNATLVAHVEENTDISYGIRADASGFEKLIRSLHMAKTTVTSPLDRSRLEDALRLSEEAINEISDIRTNIGGSLKAVDLANTVHSDALLKVQENISNIENVDVAAAMTKLSNDQLHLEASFMVLARLSSLSLVNFLR